MKPTAYRAALASQDPEKIALSEEQKQAEALAKISHRQWLEHPLTGKLLEYLQAKRETFILRVADDSAQVQEVQDTIKILRNAVRLKQIEDTIAYVRTGNAL